MPYWIIDQHKTSDKKNPIKLKMYKKILSAVVWIFTISNSTRRLKGTV